jgi:hypothetical protein
MTTPDALRSDPRIQAAIAEFTHLISEHFPSATYAVSVGDDPVGVYLDVTVDVDDPDEVVDLIINRLVTLQVDEELPFYVIPIRTPERVAAALERDRTRWSPPPVPLSALG